MRCVEFWVGGDVGGDWVRSLASGGAVGSKFCGRGPCHDSPVMSEEVSVTTRNVSKQANALAKARERRRELDKARDEQDRRVEEATATALVALEARKAAELLLREATEGLADALRRLVSQDVSIERAAALLELDAREVRRLTKLAVRNGRAPASVPGRSALPDSDARDRAAQRTD
jgi:hypothetical protein